MSYQDVKDRLYRGHRKIANHTYIVLARDVPKKTKCIVMTLHSNVVARFYPDHLELYSAGWHTNITRDRLNLALDLASVRTWHRRVYQYKWEWYYGSYTNEAIPFTEGMRINY